MRGARPAAILCAALAAGCTVGPNYREPAIAVAAAYVEPQAPGAAEADPATWWRMFGDPELDRLIAIGMAENVDIQIAASRIRQARLGVIQARAAGLPSIDATANANHIKLSKNAGLSELSSLFSGGGAGGAGGGSAGSGVGVPGNSITTYALGFDASWELDLFGGVRRQIEAARTRIDAATWNERDAQVSLAAEIADAYLQLRLAQDREAVARAELARQTRTLQIEGNTAKVGLVAQGDYTRQRAQLATTQASLPPLVAEQHVQAHAIAVLLARPPETIEAEVLVPRPILPAPPAIPAGLPSELLRRRPDIRAAERNLAAATADIGVAVADLYPRISLTGMAELLSTALGNLFTHDSFQAQGGASGMFPILDFGRRRATVAVRKEDAAQAYLRYQATVIGAFRDVEDALVRVDAERTRNAALRAGLADTTRAVQATGARYQVGLVDQTTLLDEQANILTARDSLAQSDGALREDVVSLYKALGGGWSDTEPKPPARSS